MISVQIFLLVLLGNYSIAELFSRPPKETYRAAVVEFPRYSNSTSLSIQTQINADLHIQVMRKQLAERDIDILVFPEAVFNYKQTAFRLPKSEEKKILCNDENAPKVLKEISCAIRDLKSYVTIHMYIETNCTQDHIDTNDIRPCTDNERDVNIYNAAVVFDRNGALIAIYRKYNIFAESDLQTPLKPDEIIFETDFGIKFGVFICFDILFKSPANDLISNGIKHFVYPTFWFSELPYLTALQAQNMWAYTHNVVLLAAGGNVPPLSTTGSGIYNGQHGPIHTIISDHYQLKTIIADISINGNNCKNNNEIDNEIEKSPHKPNILPGLKLLEQNMIDYQVQFLHFNESTSQIGEIEHNGVRCKYDVSVTDRQISNAAYHSYAVAVFDGLRGYFATKVKTSIKICSIIACTNTESKDSCAKRFATDVPIAERFVFNRIILEAEIRQSNDSAVAMANTLTRMIKPMQSNQYNFKTTQENEQLQYATLQLTTDIDDIQSFTIFMRDFFEDVHTEEIPFDNFNFNIEL